ncbi:MAG: gene transfer agent family protein [Robiginitomaculum sp.]|nr:gene transfer agent family protein [Robiginitomaculum sp.]
MSRETNGFQKGDVAVKIEGRTYRLRLTLGTLAHIESRLKVKGPVKLAEKIRDFSKNNYNSADALALLDCVLCAQGHNDTHVPAMIKRAKPCEYMPALARLFEETFAGMGA